MNQQVLSAGTRLLQDEQNFEIFLNTIVYLSHGGLDPRSIRGITENGIALFKQEKEKTDKQELRKWLTSSSHHRFIYHATITYLFIKGIPLDVLCPASGFKRSTLFSWKKKVLENGWKSLMRKETPGRPKKLTDQQLQEIKLQQHLFYDSPHGKKLAVYIYKKYGIKMTERSCQLLFNRLEIKRPEGELLGQLYFSDLFGDGEQMKTYVDNYEDIYKEMINDK